MRLEAAQVLLAHGADVNARDCAGQTPLMVAAARNESGEAMIEIYRSAKRELNYTARYFIDMVSNDGGRETARYLLDTKEPSEGYVVLWENGRLDLSVEAVVLRPK